MECVMTMGIVKHLRTCMQIIIGRTLFLLGIFLVVHMHSSVQGICLHDGFHYSNNTIWEAEPCTICTCIGDIISCKHKQCHNPECDFDRGEHLKIEANRCCPDCSSGAGYCNYLGEIVGHNTQWSPAPCRECFCSASQVTCRNVTCPSIQCLPGEVLQGVPGECCPTCIRPGRSCTYRGSTYQHGAEWNPVKCAKCVCNDGSSRCYVADCEPLICQQGEIPVVPEGKCCPECVGSSCTSIGHTYADGTTWKQDDCTLCRCESGSAICTRDRCSDIPCAMGERSITRPGQCCSECIPNEAPCDIDGTRWYSGDLWNVTECQFCMCKRGRVQCSTAECARTQCREGETLIQREGRCCPECQGPTGLCHFESLTYSDGESWAVENCRICSCDLGHVNCYTTDCPPCPVGTVPIMDEGRCCPECVTVQCPPECLSCDTLGCTSCRQNRLLQDARCITSCSAGYYQASDVHCLSCHESCALCSAGTEYHCLSCQPGLLHKWGQCVEECGPGFYVSDSRCLECNDKCLFCAGPRPSDCLSCVNSTNVIRDNHCVDECGHSYYLRDIHCMACDPSCSTCYPDNPSCISCPYGELLEDGRCVTVCSTRYYQASEDHCEACHPSCEVCIGPGITQCTECQSPFVLQDDQCLYNCTMGYFNNRGVCQVCHSSCRTCIGAYQSHCTSCQASNKIVQGRPPFRGTIHGSCIKKCQTGFYPSWAGTCLACNPTCETCSGSEINDCVSCRSNLVLLNGFCVRQCEDGQFSYNYVCYECHPSCSNCRGPNEDQCTSCHGSDILDSGRCIPGCQGSQFPNPLGQCQACASSCSTCFATLSGGGSACTQCSEGGNFPLGDSCVSECGVGFYQDFTLLCKECHYSCRSCDEYGVYACTSCHGGYVLTHDGQCLQSCYEGYYNDGGICKSCSSNCVQCLSPSDCLVCRDPSVVLQFGECTPACADQYYLDPVTRMCRECDWSCNSCYGPSPNECLQCMDGLFLREGACVASCGIGYYRQDGVCRECGGHCATCSVYLSCTSCQYPFFLFDQFCVHECGPGFYTNQETGTCIRCPVNCNQCLTPSECQVCNQGTFLFDGICLTDCGRDYFPNSEVGMCEENFIPPTLVVNGSITTDIGGSRVLSPSFFTAYDADTSNMDLIFIVVSPPTNGRLLKIQKGVDIVLRSRDSFTYKELMLGSVRYVHSSNNDLSGFVTFKVSDRQLESVPEDVGIIIVSPFPPFVTRNDPLVVEEGNAGQINSALNLQILDEDNPDMVEISVIVPPKHGKLLHFPGRERVRSFNLDDLGRGQVHYIHDGSETQYDAVIFQVSDGYSVLNVLFNIRILPRDNNGPILVNNIQASVVKGDVVQITSTMLKARDIDSSDSELMYTLTPPSNNPQSGEVLMIVPILPEGAPEGWIDMGNGFMQKRLVQFVQRDVDEGRIFYRNNGLERPTDYFMFEVSDSGDPPNILEDQMFNIEVLPSNDEPPRILQGVPVPLGIQIREGELTTVTANFLTFTDPDSDDSTLVYNITDPLHFSEGRLEHEDRPYLSVEQFTQADINAGKIMYRPPSSDIGSRSQHFLFSFTVTDVVPEGNTVGPFSFNFTIIPINNLEPAFRNPTPVFQVERGGQVQIRPIIADVIDLDTPVSQMVYTVVKAPQFGGIVLGGTDMLEKGDTMTRQQLIQSSLHYIHDGSNNLEDYFVISVSDGQQGTSLTASILISHVDSTSPLVNSRTTFTLYVAENGQENITPESLSFLDDDSRPEDLDIMLITNPSYGTLQRRLQNGVYEDLTLGDEFTQQEINNLDIRYNANGEIGRQASNDVLQLNITDANGNTLPRQVFTVVITPVNDQTPVVTVGNTFMINEGARQALNPYHLRATDADTQSSQLIIVVQAPPSFGRLENIRSARGSEVSRAGTEITEFSMQDLIDGSIYYVQSDHSGFEPVQDGFVFYVTDGVNNSPTQLFNITIKLINDEEPMIITEQLLVQEGQGAVIKNVTLYATDLDTPSDELVFQVTSAVSHGTLRRLDFREDAMFTGRIMGTGDTFTYQDVLHELIVYIHDGSDASMDAFSIELDDMTFRARETVHITVGLVNDETPRVTVNRGLNVEAGTTTLITAEDLLATDIDSNDDQLTFTIVSDPSVGQLQFNGGVVAPVQISSIGPRNSFTQLDIDNGFIEYLHESSDAAGTVIFKFRLADPEGHMIIDQSFIITVTEDRVPPRILANHAMVVDEGSSSPITTNCLSATDVDSIPGDLMYTVSGGPGLGHLESSLNPGVPITQFTQADLAADSIWYVHTSKEETPMDMFMFTVSDGTNEVTQTFRINISPIDDSLPVVTNYGIRVQEGVRKSLTEFELKAVDADTPEELLTFTIFSPPEHGTIDFFTDDSRYIQTLTFTMSDVYENKISYNHDGSNTLTDSFEFTVSDGTNNMFMYESNGELLTTDQAQEFLFSILPVDDGTPRIVTNLGVSYLDYVDDRALGIITERNLQTVDTDTSDRELIYTVTSPPRNGFLESILEVGVPVSVFTQEDISNGIIRYVRSDAAVSATSDRFVFDVSDTAPNVVSGTVFRIQWALIHFEKASYNVSEQQGTIGIKVKRTGNLNQYSIVLCRTEPSSAVSSSAIGARAGFNDYVEHAGQVQFEEREDTKICTIIINDDSVYEDTEEFIVELDTPAYALLGQPRTAVVAINDIEDEPTIEFEGSVMHVNESSGFLFAPMIRRGDSSVAVTVICFTIPGSATGSSLSSLESGSDYKARGMGMEYQVVFPAGVKKASCDVKIIDDALYEQEEEFIVALAMPSMRTRIGEQIRATVVIDGPNDESLIFLSNHEFVFNENAGTVDIEVHRQGSDLSHTSMVWCVPKALDPVSAAPGEDFVPSASQLTFRPQQTVEICRITIVDDTASPRMEGNETFLVYLSSTMGSALAQPTEALIVINDTSDVPTMQFLTQKVSVEEKAGVVHVPVIRAGDLRYESSVRCYTRQKTALVMMDFDERPNTENSRIVFFPGERLKNCTIRLMEDSTYEPNEQFTVKLSEPQGNELCEAIIGANSSAIVTITDREDAPMLQFERMAYSVREPSRPDVSHYVTISIVRSGDRNRTSQVRLSTRDGSAKSGVDYEPYSNLLIFHPGDVFKEIEVEILYNEDREWHETFSVVLGPDEPINAMLGPVSVATVTIIDDQAAGSIVLPSTPMVVSLMDSDDVESALDSDPSPGYPLICITPCDPHYPGFSMTGSICESAGINTSYIHYSWEVAMPTDAEGSRAPFERVVDDTPYTSCNQKVLDSIYFSRRFHVRCIAQPFDKDGRPGVPLRSNIVTIGANNGICHTPITAGLSRGLQAQSFIANLEYLEPTHPDHPNSLRVSVEIPHQDGMLPLVSTTRIHNIRLLLTQPVYRQQHICSNLINNNEFGGLADYTFLEPMIYENLFLGPGHDYPYQFDPGMRDERTLRLYKHLNLKSCTWTFDAYYHMTELIDLCGGSVTTDFQVRDGDKSFLTVTVPLHVSYIYVTAPTGWATLDHRTEMEFSFFYQTILWRTGLETDSVLSGRLQVLRIHIGEEGNMIIDFKTSTKFRGMFVPSHHTLPEYESRVVPPPELGIGFDLDLLWSEGSFDSPQQLWRATSTFNLKDYSGDYVIELLPCTVTTTQAYIIQEDGPPVCTAHPPEKFVVPIAFQQTNRPVPVIYSLNTEFHLMNNEKVFLMNPNEASISLQDMDYQGAFSKGQTIFGRVLWNPDQDLDRAYKLRIEKLYICTGADGHMPSYDPSGSLFGIGPQFGCMQESRNVKDRFLILDRGNPDATQDSFNDVPFDANFASDAAQYRTVGQMPGVDGFTMRVDPLYKVNSGHQWYMQVIYTIGPSDSMPRYRRSIMSAIEKRDAGIGGISGISSNSAHNGTNMRGLLLNQEQLLVVEASVFPLAMVSSLIGALLAVSVIILIIVFTKRKRTRKKKIISTKTEPVPLNSTRVTTAKVVAATKCVVEEIEMDLNKSVTVRSVNLNKPSNQGQVEIKVKKVNLEVKLQNEDSGGGTEV